jgi:hypothetical protein
MKSNGRKRIKKYSNSLRRAPNIEPHCYYSSDNHKNLKEVSSLDVRHNGVTFGTIVRELETKYTELTEIRNTVQDCEGLMTGLLLAYGYNTPNSELKSLIEDISQLNIIVPNIEYIGYKLVNGYVVGYGYDVICIKSANQPDDFDKGYFKVEVQNGILHWILDEDKYKALWNAVL